MGTDINISADRYIIWLDVCRGYLGGNIGVYIKGMNKPESCNTCPMFNYEYGCPLVLDKEQCPIQSVDDEQVEKTQRELVRAWTVFKSVIKDEKP